MAIKITLSKNEKNIVGIIPARFASSRLLGKPLADIHGKPMVIRTYESSKSSKLLNRIIIAVDDEKVYKTVIDFGAEAVLTPSTLQSGSDRIAYVAKNISADIVVNIQGDEPFIQGKMIDQAIQPLLFNKNIEVATLVKKIESFDDVKSPSVVKCVFDNNNDALYFSRSPVPFIRDAKTNFGRLNSGLYYKHIGLYVFKKSTLLKFTSLPSSDLENAEKLEQLRLLENGIKIRVVETEFDTFSVDTPADLESARKYFEKLFKKKKQEENKNHGKKN